jgi:hypothetical protein
MGEECGLTAYHEAGHMVVAWELGLNSRLRPHGGASLGGQA